MSAWRLILNKLMKGAELILIMGREDFLVSFHTKIINIKLFVVSNKILVFATTYFDGILCVLINDI